MFEHDLEKIGSAVSKNSENIKDFGFSAKNLAENPKNWRGLIPRIPSFLDVWMYRQARQLYIKVKSFNIYG